MNEKTNKEPKPEPNLKFTGKRKRWNKKEAKLEDVPRDVPSFVINGRDKITLPEDLHKGAFVAPREANVVKQLFGRDFKTPQPAKK